MKKLLITLILVSCIILTACGPGTAEIYIFGSFDELIEILDGRFMFPTYYPEGFDPDVTENIVTYGDFAELGVENQKILYKNFYRLYYIIRSNKKIYNTFYLDEVYIGFINYESSIYETRIEKLLQSKSDIKYLNNGEVYIFESVYPIEPYDIEMNQTRIYNSYILYKDKKPYYLNFKIIINTTNEERVAEFLTEINEMTYTEAIKMFDSLQPIE